MTVTATTPASGQTTGWTLAYRKRGANRFLRVDGLDLTWEQATELGNRLAATDSKLQVFTVSTRAAEDDGRVPEEDVANVLVESGRRKARVRIKEGGLLPDGLEPLSPADASKAFRGEDDAEQSAPAVEVAEEQPAAAEEPAVQADAEQPADGNEEPAEQPAHPLDGDGSRYPWSVAYRTPGAKRYRRVPDLSLTEDEATALSERWAAKYPKVTVCALWSRQAEIDGLIAAEDHGVMTVDGTTYKIIETGVLPLLDDDEPAQPAEEQAAPAVAPKADAKPRGKRTTGKGKAAASKPTPAPTVADGITVTRVTDGGKRDLVATRKGKVIGRAVGYNGAKPNGSMYFKGWKIMDASGKKQLGHVVFQVGVAKAELKLRELVAA